MHSHSRRSWAKAAFALAIGCVLPREVAAAEPVVERFALIVGSNESQVEGQDPLRFADDDAARLSELLLETGVDVELLTAFDRDSQVRHGKLIDRARPPTRAELDLAWAELVGRMETAERSGARVELLIYYSGHGELGADGRHFLTLADGDRLTRSDLFQDLIGKSPADRNHLIIDACRNGEFVLSRGDWQPDRSSADDYQAELDSYLDDNRAGNHPSLGILLASSADQKTHEWERYRGGVFTHELLSGLRGGADVNGDGRIEYSEIGGFISAANSGVKDPRAHLEVMVRPPSVDERAAIVVHEQVDQQRLLLMDGGEAGRYSVEDERGVRLADVHVGTEPAYLRLPAGRLYVHRLASTADRMVAEAELGASASGIIELGTLEFSEVVTDARGSLDAALREGLFSVAYGRSYYAGYSDREDLLQVDEAQWQLRVLQRDPSTGELVEVSRIEGPASADTLTVPHAAPPHPIGIREAPYSMRPDNLWLGLSFAVDVGLGRPPSALASNRDVVYPGELAGLDDRRGRVTLRGFEGSITVFGAAHPNDPQLFEFGLRTGYRRGTLNFLALDEAASFQAWDPTRLSVTAIPIALGGNLFIGRDSPVRGVFGAHVGGRVLDIEYERFAAPTRERLYFQAGGALLGGIELRVTTYFFARLVARAAFYDRVRIDGLPDLGGVEFTTMIEVGSAIPLGKTARKYGRSIDFGRQYPNG